MAGATGHPLVAEQVERLTEPRSPKTRMPFLESFQIGEERAELVRGY
jgi:hypothetical protein